MNDADELKWMTKRYSWRYIPLRYQALVATIVSAFLYYNVFELFFNPINSSSGACGTLLRPTIESVDGTDTNLGWIWDSGVTLFTRNDDLRCPRAMQGMWWEFFASFGALAICGLVLRRAIKRDNAAASA